jgi:hypothetical protein
MGLPLLKDFLPDDEPDAQVPGAASDSLEAHETKLIRAEAKAAALRAALERFVAFMGELLPKLSEEDVFLAFEQIEAEDLKTRPAFASHIQEAQERRARVARLRNSPAKARALHLYDREIRMLRLALASFDWSKEQMETLRDAVLVREAQEFSRHGFWGADDEG